MPPIAPKPPNNLKARRRAVADLSRTIVEAMAKKQLTRDSHQYPHTFYFRLVGQNADRTPYRYWRVLSPLDPAEETQCLQTPEGTVWKLQRNSSRQESVQIEGEEDWSCDPVLVAELGWLMDTLHAGESRPGSSTQLRQMRRLLPITEDLPNTIASLKTAMSQLKPYQAGMPSEALYVWLNPGGTLDFSSIRPPDNFPLYYRIARVNQNMPDHENPYLVSTYQHGELLETVDHPLSIPGLLAPGETWELETPWIGKLTLNMPSSLNESPTSKRRLS